MADWFPTNTTATGTESPYELNATWFDALNNPSSEEPMRVQVRRFLVSHAIMLAMQGLPAVYFHSLIGSRNDPEGARRSAIARRINRQKLGRAALEQDLRTPGTRASIVFNGFRALLSARRSSPAFHPSAEQRICRGDTRVFAVLRTSSNPGESVLCLHNVAGEPVDYTMPKTGREGSWRILYSSSGNADSTPVSEGGVRLLPYDAVWLTNAAVEHPQRSSRI